MPRPVFRLLILLLATLLTACGRSASASGGPPVDLIYVNGKVFTGDAVGTIAEAVAIRDGRIAAVGTNDETLALSSSS